MRISPKTIQLCKSQKEIKTYAAWLYLKGLFKNSCIYKYSVYRLSKLSNLSRTAVRKYISLFLHHGWCRIHCGNLIFEKQEKLTSSTFTRLINIKAKELTISGIKDALNIFKIANKQKQIVFASTKDPHKGGVRHVVPGETPPLTVAAASGLFATGYRNANRILLDLQGKKWFKRTRIWHTVMRKLPPVGYAALKEAKQINFPHIYVRRLLIEVLPSKFEWLVHLPLNPLPSK